MSSVELKTLWKHGHEWIQSPKKDFTAGELLFKSIVEIDPKDFWVGHLISPINEKATLLVGGCITWAHRAEEGEPWIRKALLLNGQVPNGYTMLAQNLEMQGKTEDMLLIVWEMIERDFPQLSNDADQQEKVRP